MSHYPKKRGLYLDLGHTSLKVLLDGRGLELPLERAARGEWTSASKQALARELKKFLGSSRRGVCALPARGVSLRSLTLPQASKEETRKLIALQVEKEFPLPPAELAWGYSVHGGGSRAENGGEMGSLQEIVLLAVRRQFLEGYSSLLEECGVRATFQLGALASSCMCPLVPGSYCLLDIGKAHSELLVLEDGKARSLRSFAWGGESVTHAIGSALKVGLDEAEELKCNWKGASQGEKAGIPSPIAPELSPLVAKAVGELARLVREALPFRPVENGARPPIELFLVGGGSRLPGLGEALAQGLGGGVACKVVKLERAPGLSSATLGLAQEKSHGNGTLSLSLEKKGERELDGQAPSGRPWLIFALFLAALALVMRYGPPLWKLSDLKARIADAQKLRDSLPRVDTELGFLEYLEERQLPCLETLAEVAKAAPQGASLSAVSMSRQGEVSLQGRVPGLKEVNDFRSRLTLSGRFSQAVLQEGTPDKEKKYVDFRIRAQLRPGGGAQGAPASSTSTPPERK